MSNEIKYQAEEMSIQELDAVAGGAISAANSEVENLQDEQLVINDVSRDGIKRINVQRTDDFKATLAEFNQTGK